MVLTIIRLSVIYYITKKLVKVEWSESSGQTLLLALHHHHVGVNRPCLGVIRVHCRPCFLHLRAGRAAVFETAAGSGEANSQPAESGLRLSG